jgi:hypothetical protein
LQGNPRAPINASANPFSLVTQRGMSMSNARLSSRTPPMRVVRSGLCAFALIFGPGARIERQPAPGAYAGLRGRLDPMGKVIVERLREH